MTQETLHGDEVPTHAEDPELRAVVQGRQDGLKVGAPDSTLF